MSSKADILSSLRKDILSLQGCRSPLYAHEMDVKLGPVASAFPNATFPTSAVHEFICSGHETKAATCGFIGAILSSLVKNNRACIWISRQRNIFPPALQAFGIEPQQVIFIQPLKEKDLLWTMEEALRCDALSAVVCEAREISFIASRRLQLAVEESHVTGFIIRQDPRNLATACDARWKISSLAGEVEEGLPGVGYPRWQIELLKVRNGKPGNWEATWKQGRFLFEQNTIRLLPKEKKKAG